MSTRSSPAGTTAAPQGNRLKTVLSAGLDRLSLHCTPCNDPMDQDDLVKNYGKSPLEHPGERTPQELEQANVNMCQICFVAAHRVGGVSKRVPSLGHRGQHHFLVAAHRARSELKRHPIVGHGSNGLIGWEKG